LDDLRPDAVAGDLRNSGPEIYSTQCGKLLEVLQFHELARLNHLHAEVFPVSDGDPEAEIAVAKVAMLSRFVFEKTSDDPDSVTVSSDVNVVEGQQAVIPAGVASVASLVPKLRSFRNQRGPMVPQKRYEPQTSADRLRYVDKVNLRPPIHFVMQNPDEEGIPLRDAKYRRLAHLVARDEPMFEKGDHPSISIRLNVSLAPRLLSRICKCTTGPDPILI
jgi:hypothetical protein